MSDKIEYEERVLSKIVCKKGDPIFAEGVTTVTIEDIASGEFIVMSQSGDEFMGRLAFDEEEWEQVKRTVDSMFKECRDYD